MFDVDPMEPFFLSLDRRMKFPKNGRSSGRLPASFPWKDRSSEWIPYTIHIQTYMLCLHFVRSCIVQIREKVVGISYIHSNILGKGVQKKVNNLKTLT